MTSTMLQTYMSSATPGKYSHSRSSMDIDREEAEAGPYMKTRGDSSDLPKPLNIAKQDNECDREEQEDDTPRARPKHAGASRTISHSASNSSAGSERSNFSMDSLPEPLGGERPLTIPKRRDNNASRTSLVPGDSFHDMNPNMRNEHGAQEQRMADVMASLGRMTLDDRAPENRAEDNYDTGPGSPKPRLQSAQSRASHIPRAHPKLSSKPSLMFLGRRYNDSGSESASSCYSDTNNDSRSGSNRIPQGPSPSPSFRSTPGVSTTSREGYGLRQHVRNSPYLRSVKSMHLMSTAAVPLYGFDGEVSLPSPISAVTPGLTADLPGGDGNGSRNYSSDFRQSSFDDPHILVPKIVVTPETKILEDGATGLWAAVQISTQIRPANSSAYQQEDNQTVRGPSQLDVFRYGCLYNVSVEVLSTESSVIVDLLNDQAYAINTTLYPGSRMLIMAHVKLLNRLPSSSGAVYGLRRETHARQSSDDLIQDLEHHLGNRLVEYLQIRIKYHHSSFPHQKQDQSPNQDGILEVDTTIETTARAAIKQHNSTSLWSPRPALQPNPLFEIIASHWGSNSAGEVMQRIINSRNMAPHAGERKTTPLQTRSLPVISPPRDSREYRGSHFPTVREGSEETVKPIIAPVPTRLPPPIPKRQASLHCPPPQTATNEQTQASGPPLADKPPIKKTVWSQLRRASLTERGKPKTVTMQRSFIKSSVTRVPSIDLAHSSSHGTIQAPSTQAMSLSPADRSDAERAEATTFSGQSFTLRGTRSLNHGILKQGHTNMGQQSGDSKYQNGDFPTPSVGGHNTAPSPRNWAARASTLGRSSKRGGNEMIDEERARRRQKMLIEQAATISLARGNSGKRGSFGGTLPRGGGGAGGTLDTYGSRRYRQPPLGTDMYRGGGSGEDHHRNDGGIYTYGVADGLSSRGKKDEKSGTGRTGTGRWGWSGWWP